MIYSQLPFSTEEIITERERQHVMERERWSICVKTTCRLPLLVHYLLCAFQVPGRPSVKLKWVKYGFESLQRTKKTIKFLANFEQLNYNGGGVTVSRVGGIWTSSVLQNGAIIKLAKCNLSLRVMVNFKWIYFFWNKLFTVCIHAFHHAWKYFMV